MLIRNVKKTPKKVKKYKIKIAAVLCGLVIIGVGYFIFSTFEYQSLINQGSVIADDQCMKVNPLIIEKKNSYLATMKVLFDSQNADLYWTENDKYLQISQKYVDAQNVWLQAEKTYMDRWDFQTFVPSYIRAAGRAQFASRQADAIGQQALIDAFTAKDAELQKKLIDIVDVQDKKSKEADDLFNKIWDSPKPFDLRSRFITVPKSICPAENFNIPVVPDYLHPTPTQVNFN